MSNKPGLGTELVNPRTVVSCIGENERHRWQRWRKIPKQRAATKKQFEKRQTVSERDRLAGTQEGLVLEADDGRAKTKRFKLQWGEIKEGRQKPSSQKRAMKQ